MMSYLLELRRRGLSVFAFFIVLFSLCFYFSNDIFLFLVQPLLKVLPDKNFMVATDITAPLITPLKLAANLSLLGTIPFALYHTWLFVAPALYRNERYNLQILISLSLLLFICGVLFCFYWVLPYMLNFFSHALPFHVRYLPDMTNTLDFITRMLIIFGLCFQVPLVCFFMVRLHLAELQTLKKIRPYIVVAAFIIGMLLTPPDVISQIMLAIPLWFLYEIGIILAVLFGKKEEIEYRQV
ncbi:twin-arginine translocase subunit TatC [Legionella adelaidensis]|uniref:twin-arginine translocase subunit TatC n=1 Tax=Legionella adelaidensis TaxID=45056 RepID=UPI0010412861|nr:twin-arginine translocase subunit TatC [Legionella adelaidensis]